MGPNIGNLKGIAFVNNPISAALLEGILHADEIDPSELCLILVRPFERPWMKRAGMLLRYPAPASLRMAGQLRFVGFYWQARSLIRKALKSPLLREIYIVNNDNLIAQELLRAADNRPTVRVSVIAEGLMNFQDITLENRAAWRASLKKYFGRLLGYSWTFPTGHLSGAYETTVKRVVTFKAQGMHAPLHKLVQIPLAAPVSRPTMEPCTALFVECPLWQWMEEADFKEFSERFARWFKSLGIRRLVVKPHPNYAASHYLRSLLGPHEVLADPRSVEDMAGEIQAGVAVGTCSTALMTLKMLRPDIRCLDFGADWYVPKAYNGKDGVVVALSGVGVEIVQSEPYA